MSLNPLVCLVFYLFAAALQVASVSAQTLAPTPAPTLTPLHGTQLADSSDPSSIPRLQALAAQGNAVAQFNLGVLHDVGRGVAQNHSLAAQWYALAAAQGHGGAQFNLGGMYFEGQGVAQDYVRAYMWFTLGGTAGYAGATRNRNSMAALMTPEQLAQAQTLARDCQRRNFKNCG